MAHDFIRRARDTAGAKFCAKMKAFVLVRPQLMMEDIQLWLE